jgi:hypothetical protein
MADEETQDSPQGDRQQGSSTGSFVKKLFAKKGEAGDADQEPKNKPPQQGVAHIPSTVLTVEYLDSSDGMDAALKDIGERVQKMETTLGTMQGIQSQLISAVNQQARELGKLIESVGRRVDKLYRRMSGREALPSMQTTFAAPVDEEAPAMAQHTALAKEVADDPTHQNAWRIARVLAADLEAYHEDAVREGVLYGTFYKLLREPIEKARHAYEERVPEEIVENYDYFSKALDELIARKRMELEEGE